jgi:NADPH-dependent curcumin reductase CurA
MRAADMSSREIRLRRRPERLPRESDFELTEAATGEPGPGQVLVRNLFLSVDPYQRNRMRNGLAPGDIVPGRCVGEVVQSRHADFREGDQVFNSGGWREMLLTDGGKVSALDRELTPMQLHLGIAGTPGLTAYVGLLDHGHPKAGETVFVSAAAGAVGSMVCQIAKILGCRVVGSAGSDEKVRWLVGELGVDAAINYQASPDLSDAIRRACPDGIDVLFDSVGDPQLDDALASMRPGGRIVLCGLIGRINDEVRKPGLTNLEAILMKRLTLRGFGVNDHLDRMPAFRADLKRWLAEGRISWRETIVDGIENAPRAFIGLFRGQNLGKMLVRLGQPPEK